MKIIDRAQALQDKIDKKISDLPELSASTYLQFIGVVFIVTGIGLFMYCRLKNINPFETQILSSPIFYLIQGFVLLCFRYVVKNN